MRVDAQKQRPVDAAPGPEITNGLRDGQNMQFVERKLDRRTSVPGRAKGDALRRNGGVRDLGVLRADELFHIYER